VSFEQATAYCAWLNAVTGVDGAECYRLGTRAEMAALYDPKDRVENTLDYWAGYAVNLDDALRLRQEVAELGSEAPLLKEVGSYQGTDSDEPVYDLGGNVAEWAIDEDGRACALGGSADIPADPKLRRRDPAPEYIGFRVVRGQVK
jgi:formylglycine-generating enzyme required for sulfatase activity